SRGGRCKGRGLTTKRNSSLRKGKSSKSIIASSRKIIRGEEEEAEEMEAGDTSPQEGDPQGVEGGEIEPTHVEGEEAGAGTCTAPQVKSTLKSKSKVKGKGSAGAGRKGRGGKKQDLPKLDTEGNAALMEDKELTKEERGREEEEEEEFLAELEKGADTGGARVPGKSTGSTEGKVKGKGRGKGKSMLVGAHKAKVKKTKVKKGHATPQSGRDVCAPEDETKVGFGGGGVGGQGEIDSDANEEESERLKSGMPTRRSNLEESETAAAFGRHVNGCGKSKVVYGQGDEEEVQPEERRALMFLAKAHKGRKRSVGEVLDLDEGYEGYEGLVELGVQG
ncbi:unnamed protein product, partial [Choristocarpus tenellus]